MATGNPPPEPPAETITGTQERRWDCQWIAQLLQCGLLKGSFIPPRAQRDLRTWCDTERNWWKKRRAPSIGFNYVKRLERLGHKVTLGTNIAAW